MISEMKIDTYVKVLTLTYCSFMVYVFSMRNIIDWKEETRVRKQQESSTKALFSQDARLKEQILTPIKSASTDFFPLSVFFLISLCKLPYWHLIWRVFIFANFAIVNKSRN